MAEEKQQSQTQAVAGAIVKRLAKQALRKAGAVLGGWGVLITEVGSRLPWKWVVAGVASWMLLPFLIIIVVLLAILGGAAPGTTQARPTNICSEVTTTTFAIGMIDLLNRNIDIYRQAAAEADIPWEALAAIHYEEHNNSRVTPIDHPETSANERDDGVYQIVSKSYPYPELHILTDAEFLEQSRDAAHFIQNKATNSTTPGLAEPLRQNMDPADAQDAANIKDAFWGYNGRASYMMDIAESLGYDPADQGYEGSFYVMNNWDEERVGMQMRWVDGDGVLQTRTMSRDGAWKIFIVLRTGDYGDDGKLVALNLTCDVLEPGESTDTPTGCPLGHGKVGGWLYMDPAHPTIHEGIDMSNLGGVDGDRARATHTGNVTWVSVFEHPAAGYFVVVQNATYKTRYLHLAAGSIPVTVGQEVVRGDVVGIQGSTGDSSGPHLHYEVYQGGVVTDPTSFIPMANVFGAECER